MDYQEEDLICHKIGQEQNMNREASSQRVNFSLCLVQFTFGACNKLGFL